MFVIAVTTYQYPNDAPELQYVAQFDGIGFSYTTFVDVAKRYDTLRSALKELTIRADAFGYERDGFPLWVGRLTSHGTVISLEGAGDDPNWQP